MQVTNVEDIREYTYGGYALVSIGKVLGGRYEVVDKLGHSISATTWLCWVQGTRPPEAAWMAVKLFKTTCSAGSAMEMTKKRQLIEKGGSEEEWAAAHVAMPIDEFRHGDVHGSHRCLVMPLLGSSLEFLGVEHPLTLESRLTLKRFLFEAGLALKYLHRHRVTHGEVTPRKIRFQLDIPNASALTVEDMKDVLGLETRKHLPVLKAPGYPIYLIQPTNLEKLAPVGHTVLLAADSAGKAPQWYQAPEVLTGLNKEDNPGGDVWSFCCTILAVYSRCSLGLSDATSSDAKLMRHVKFLERILGPMRRPSAYTVDEDGEFLEYLPPRRMCESEEDYERWERRALGEPAWATTPLKALLGSVSFRRLHATGPVEPEAVLPEAEADKLAALLGSALCYNEEKRSMQAVLKSEWFAQLRVDGFQITKTANPLLELLNLDVARADVFDLLAITRDVQVLNDEVLFRKSPAQKIKDEQRALAEVRASKRGDSDSEQQHFSDSDHVLRVCREYRDYGELVLMRVRELVLRADDCETHDDRPRYDRYISKINKLLREYARYRAERTEFYRTELGDANTSSELRQEMLLEFPDQQDGELDPEDPPSQKDAEGIASAETNRDLRGPEGNSDIVAKDQQEKVMDETKDFELVDGTRKPSAEIYSTAELPDIAKAISRLQSISVEGRLIAEDVGIDPPGEQDHLKSDGLDEPDLSTTSAPEGKSQSPQVALVPLPTTSETVEPLDEPLTGKDAAPATVATEELPLSPREMRPDTDTPGQETLNPNTDIDEVIEAASNTPLPASGNTSPTDSDPDTQVVFAERSGEKVPELSSDNAKVVLSTVERFVEPHLQKLLVRLESGDPVVSYVLILCAAGILALCILLFVLVVRAGDATTGEPIGNAASSEVRDWLRTRVVSPYSELHERLCQSPSCQGETNGGNSTDGGNSLTAYLVTHFSKLS
ncbi:kinase-like protein [Apiospora marii]|uniref:kinase-like protein n=1 Tax=Apiospora marii TaxID=335849 RepID=UPI00312F18A8